MPNAHESSMRMPNEVEVLILGAGVCGVSVGAGLLRAGTNDFLILERADGPGGTWRHNTYPGCAVDIPTHLYSFAWDLNPEWSRVFAPQNEVKEYLEKIVVDTGLDAKTRYGVEVLDASWDEAVHCWEVTTTHGTISARHFVSAAGPLHEPMLPDTEGIGTFQGESFHSSEWPESIDLMGKRVVVIGTGASALQFIPAIQPEVAHMTVLQRTPSWVMPKPDWTISKVEKRALRMFPFLMRPYRLAMWGFMDLFLVLATHHPRIARSMGVFGKLHMRRSIKDRQTRKALTPDYAPTCKRLGFSNDFYPAMAQANVELVTSPAARILPSGVETTDGRVFDADVIIYGTGFHTLQTHPVNDRITGRDGTTLAERWAGSPTAYMGTSVAEFPNFYCMFGPNVGTLSGFVMADAQTDYILGAIKAMKRQGATSLDVRRDAEDEFVEYCDDALRTSTFALGGCASYYLAADGTRVSLPWPGSMTGLRRALQTFEPEKYDASRVADSPAAARASVS